MARGGLFAKDWQLLKLSRSERRHDIAGPLVRLLLDEDTPAMKASIERAARTLGAGDAEALLARLSLPIDRTQLAESMLLMWGIPFERQEKDGRSTIRITRGPGPSGKPALIDERISVPYLSGYFSVLVPGAAVRDDGKMLAIEIRDRE